MLALYIIGGILLALVLLLQLRVGIEASLGDETRVWVKAAFFKKTVIPAAEKKPSEQKKKKSKPAAKPSQETKKKKFALSGKDVLILLPYGWKALQKGLRATRRRVKIDPVDLSIIAGGDDPADIAQVYGWMNAAMWTAMPVLEQLCCIPDPHIHLGMDYDAEKTAVTGKIGAHFRLWDGLAIAFAFVGPILRWFVKMRKSEKQTPAPKTKEAQNTPKEMSA